VIMTNIAGTAADEALRKLAAELYKSFSNKPAQSGASVWPVNHEGNQRSLVGPEEARGPENFSCSLSKSF
jgi:hypothetical protein